MKKPALAQPLAERYRPKNLSDVVGQEHLTAQDNFLRSIIKNNQLVSMILWGPPGSGKTTLARIVGNTANNDFIELSAVTTGLAEVRKVIAEAKTRQDQGVQTVLFVDEIHRFNKAQQDAFLPHLEAGTIVLIGATTENPSFEVIRPLLSRSRVVVLEPLSKENIIEIITRAQKSSGTNKVDLKALDLLAELSGGDARMALNGLEVANTISKGAITTADIKQAMQKMTTKYDKSGEYHFNLISAYIKSMRGSDVEATLYYLARMLDGGEDPKFIARRNIIFASEDIGLSAPAALNLAVSTFLAVERIGLPECNYCLFECATVLAKSQKSRSVSDAMSAAFKAAKDYSDAPVPLHLRNAPTKLMSDLGYQEGSKWEAGFKHPKGFLPEEIKDLELF